MSIANQYPELTESVSLPNKHTGSLVLPDRAISKAEIPNVAKELVETLCEFTDSLTAYVMLKQAAEIVKSAQEQTVDLAMMNFNGKEMNVFGAKVKTRALTEYEYDDPILRDLEGKLEVLKAEIDSRKKMLRTIKQELVLPETGELIKPAVKTRDGLTLTVSFS